MFTDTLSKLKCSQYTYIYFVCHEFGLGRFLTTLQEANFENDF